MLDCSTGILCSFEHRSAAGIGRLGKRAICPKHGTMDQGIKGAPRPYE